jgi:hypothetical protein
MELTPEQYAEAQERAKALQEKGTFNARAAVNNATYPADQIDVYSDARVAHEVNVAAHEAALARGVAQNAFAELVRQAAENGTVESDPEAEAKEDATYKALDAEATELEAKVAELLPGLEASKLTFHLRGLAPKQWRLIHSLGRKEIKAPVRRHFENGEDGDEAFQAEEVERNILRNAWINNACIAPAIVKVVNPKGEEDTGVWTVDDVATIDDTYLESEYAKLKNLMEQLTFANTLFQRAIEQDADFLPRR